MIKKEPKVILAKPGLDGHDKGIRLVAMALRDAGMNVTYLGLRQQASVIVAAAVARQADFIGLSILSGVHLEVAAEMLDAMKQANIGHIPLLIGGVIPPQDVVALEEMGVAQVFPVGSNFASMVEWIDHFQQACA